MAQRRTRVVLVEDRLSHNQNLQIACLFEAIKNLFGRLRLAKLEKVLIGFFGERRQVIVNQKGGARRQLIDELHTGAHQLGDPLFFEKFGRLPIPKLGPLDVDMWLEESERIAGRWPLVDAHVVDTVESGERFGPQTLLKNRPVRSFVDQLVWRDRNRQHIAESPGFL